MPWVALCFFGAGELVLGENGLERGVPWRPGFISLSIWFLSIRFSEPALTHELRAGWLGWAGEGPPPQGVRGLDFLGLLRHPFPHLSALTLGQATTLSLAHPSVKLGSNSVFFLAPLRRVNGLCPNSWNRCGGTWECSVEGSCLHVRQGLGLGQDPQDLKWKFSCPGPAGQRSQILGGGRDPLV